MSESRGLPLSHWISKASQKKQRRTPSPFM
jgi:hypothetical protein